MSTPNATRWIGIGLLGLPLYGALTFWSSLEGQPDPDTQLEAWARFVTTNKYVIGHLFGSILGLICLIFGAFALFGIFLVLWIGKNVRDYRQGNLLFPSVLLIGLTIVIGFTLPLFPNLDVAFQGFNCWHSFQYLALIWYLNLMRKERGELDNHFIAESNGPDRPWRFYALNVALTAAAGALARAR